MLILANWDHGYFSADNPEVDAFDNSAEARHKRNLATHAAIEAYLRGGTMPAVPGLTVKREGDGLTCSLTPDAGPIEHVALQASLDGAYTFREIETKRVGDTYEARVEASDTATLEGAALFAEVEYEGGPVLTSAPWLGPAFEQRMRPSPEPKE